MVDEYLLAGAIIFFILLLTVCVFLVLLYRRCKMECARNEQQLLRQLTEKTDFFTDMTHELKTPLSVILGAVQLMEMKKSVQCEEDSSFNKNLRIIKCNCYRLLRLTNNLLDMTRMEAGYLKLKPVNCNLSLLLEEIVQSVLPYAAQNQLSLEYSKPSEAISMAVDIEKIERIMLNLLSNAIKFTKPGGTIKVSSYAVEERIFISVKDSGTGIPVENQEEVFNRFKQLGNSPIIENKGSGIGLSLVKSFVTLHMGNIKIISKPDQGSEFIIDLPIRHVQDESNGFDSEEYNRLIAEAARIEFSVLHTVAS